jgi:hypothetical protein
MCGYKPRHAPLVGSRLRSRSGSLAMLLAKRAGILMPRARRTQARLLLAIDTRGECPIVGVADYGTLLCSDLGRPPAPPGIAMVCARRPLWSVGHAPGADRQAHVGAMVHEMAIAGRTDRRVRSPGEPMPREPQPLRPSSSLVLIACPPAPAGSHACGEFSVLPLMKIKWSSAVCRSAR